MSYGQGMCDLLLASLGDCIIDDESFVPCTNRGLPVVISCLRACGKSLALSGMLCATNGLTIVAERLGWQSVCCLQLGSFVRSRLRRFQLVRSL